MTANASREAEPLTVEDFQRLPEDPYYRFEAGPPAPRARRRACASICPPDA